MPDIHSAIINETISLIVWVYHPFKPPIVYVIHHNFAPEHPSMPNDYDDVFYSSRCRTFHVSITISWSSFGHRFTLSIITTSRNISCAILLDFLSPGSESFVRSKFSTRSISLVPCMKRSIATLTLSM